MTINPVGIDHGVVGQSHNSKDKLLCCEVWEWWETLGESQVFLPQLMLVIAVELIQLGCDRYDGYGNTLERWPTHQIARRGNGEAPPDDCWESDL